MAQVKSRVYKGYNLPPGLPDTINPIRLIRRLSQPVKTTGEARQYGDFALIATRPMPTFAIYHPELLRSLIEDYPGAVVRATIVHVSERTAGITLVTADGEKRRKLRAQIEPVLGHQQIVEDLASTMTQVADRIQGQWSDGATIDLKTTMEDMILRITTRCMFRHDFEDDAMFQDVMAAMESHIRGRNYTPPLVAALMYAIPLPETLRIKRQMKNAHRMLDKIMAENKDSGLGLMNMMLNSYDPQTGDYMTEAEVKSEFLASLITSHHIMASQTMWIWHLLDTYPDKASLVYEEIDSVLGSRLPTIEDMRKLTATHQFILEALRFSPAFYMDMRNVVKSIEFGGYQVPPNSAIAIPLIWISRDPRWWDDPDEFKPERWKPGFRESLPPFVYNAFLSDSPTNCVAEHYSMMVMTLSLVTMGRYWRMRMPEGFEPKMSYTINRTVKGKFPMILERRSGM